MLIKMVEVPNINLNEWNSNLEALLKMINDKNKVLKTIEQDLITKAENIVYAAKESVLLRKIQAVFLKMKIYFQRLKALNVINILKKVKKLRYHDYSGDDDFIKWINYNRSIKREIEELSDTLRQFHSKMGKTNSSLLGFLTSMMYYNADLWETVNILSLNNYSMRK